MSARCAKTLKAQYDRNYRALNRERLKRQKAEWFKRTYDPQKAAIERRARMPYHILYCRQPDYVSYKNKYDLQRRAKRYGVFAECYLLFQVLRQEIKRQEPDRFERYKQAGRFAWNPEVQKRRKENARKKAEEFIRSIGFNGL